MKPQHVRRLTPVEKLTGDFERFKRELGRRIMEHPSAHKNGSGKWDCRALCHDGKGTTGLFYDPLENFIWCNAEPPCDLVQTIAPAFGVSFDSESSGGRERGSCDGSRTPVRRMRGPRCRTLHRESSDRLGFAAPEGALTPELRALLVAHKPAVTAALYELEERAAIEGAPEWLDARAWRLVDTPAVRFLLACGFEIASVSLAGLRSVEEREVAA